MDKPEPILKKDSEEHLIPKISAGFNSQTLEIS